MTERQSMILKLIGLVAIATAMGLVLYFLFFGGRPPIVPTPDNQTPDTTTSPGGLPNSGSAQPGLSPNNPEEGTGSLPVSPVASGGVTQTTTLTTGPIFSPTIMANGDITYYDPNDGHFYTIDDDGNVVLLSQAQFPVVEEVTFASDASAAVIEFPDGSNVVYDFTTASQTTLPSHWEDFSFSSDGNSLATKSVGADPSNRSLVITSTDGTNAQVIANLGGNEDAVSVNWSPNNQIVGFSATGPAGSAFGQNEIYLIGQDGEAAGVLIVNGNNFKGLWSPDGNNLLYSVADAGDEYRASLWYGDSEGDRNGDTRLRLSLKTTVDKCVFASNTLAYCAVPSEMPAGGGITPSLVTAPDLLFSLSLPSGQSRLVAIPETDTRMFNLSVSPDGGELFYTDSAGRLNVIQLK